MKVHNIELPDEIHKLINLDILSLHNNKLKSLPLAITALPKLRVLIVSVNKLKELPQGFGTCPSLRYLDISYNDIESLRSNFGFLSTQLCCGLIAYDNNCSNFKSAVL